MLEAFTLSTFADRLGDTFVVGEGSDALETRLVEAASLGPASGEDGRPFSLVFVGPLDPILPQQIYRFEHEALDSFELFIVPIGPDESDGMQYEAVFS
ncbi:MAG: hypothetical protein QOG85_1565 [Gaiellaceae bacterium]|jgi:hypothetical protein|nr:hypothetical protein [Gaiellaceae bacterium]